MKSPIHAIFSRLISRSGRKRRNGWRFRNYPGVAEVLETRQLMTATPADVSQVGRGQDLLLVVNPNDENALRVANLYQQLRHIPDRNIVFIEPPLEDGFPDMSLEPEEFVSQIVTPIANAIRDRGLSSQIDFIGALGMPARYRILNPNGFGLTSHQSLSYGLTQVTQYVAGLDPALAHFVTTAISDADPRTAIHHSTSYNVTYNDGTMRATQYYLGGLVAFTGSFGNSVDQVLANLARSASADGTRPVGTIYFEENDNVRSETRESQWPAAKAVLQARAIPVVEERNTDGATPLGRTDVRGAVVGASDPILPNGSTYLPGSWADNLTSYGGAFGPAQTKATEFLRAGAAATSGTVEEPFAFPERFTSASIFTSIDDGLTLAEAYAHSIQRPDMSQFFGDLLAQPYADLPRVQITAGPTDGQTVSGSVSLTANASLIAPRFATTISRLELYVDGSLRQTINAGQGNFTVDSNTLSDGVHEFRIVAVNNARAESEGIALRQLVVNNRGRSVTASAANLTATSQQQLNVTVATTLRSGSVERVELRHLGRTLGQVAGGNGTVTLDASRLAFGENQVIPVAIYSDGEQVSGTRLVVQRLPEVFVAQTASNPVDRTAGIRAEYFVNQGAASIAQSNFSGTPTFVRQHTTLTLNEQDGSPTVAANELATTQIDRLAIRFTGRFEVTGDNSEYLFSLLGTNDSARLSIDGQSVIAFDDRPYGITQSDASARMFLAPGEHTFELLVSNLATDLGEPVQRMRTDLRLRGPDGVTRMMNDQVAFVADSTTPTPNRAPVGVVDSFEATQGMPLDVTAAAGVLANDTDADGHRLTARLDAPPQHGTLALQAEGSFRYTPDADFAGTDQFTYVANDGQVDSAATTVELVVNRFVPPTPPTAVIDNVSPDPRNTPVGVVTVNFSEAVTGVDASDFQLTRNGAPVTLSGLSVTRITATQYTLDLTPFTSSVGNYELTLRAASSGVVDLEGTALADDANETWQTNRSFYFSTTSGGSLTSSNGSKVSFKDADILRLVINADGTFQYSMAFDGSDVGLTTSSEDVDAFVVLPDGRLVLSTVGAFSVPSNGGMLKGGGEDLLLFTPTTLGDTTAGTWSLYFDGSDVGLSGSNETVDSVAVLADGRILVSTAGAVSVPGIKGDDEDLLEFTPTSLGASTAGQWTLYFDGSDVGLTTSSEDVAALFVEESATVTTLHLATTGNFSVTGSAGTNEDIFTFRPTNLGASTTGTFAPGLTLDGSLYRLAPFALDGIALGSQLSLQPEITVTDVSSATNIVDGQTTAIDFGNQEESSTASIKTFRIRNDGTALLNLGPIQLPTGFLQVAPLASTTLRPGDAVELQIRLDTAAVGTKSGQVVIHNNDADESPFNFTVKGTVTARPVDPPDPAEFTFFSNFENEDVEAWQAHLTREGGYNVAGTGGFIKIGRGAGILLTNTDHAHSGQTAMQVTYAQDEDAGEATVVIPDDGTDYVRTAQFVRFGETFDFGLLQKIHRVSGFNTVTGLNDFDIVVVALGQPRPGLLERDMTGTNDNQQVSINYNGGPHDWGAAHADFTFERGRYYELVTEVTLNTPGQSDGEVRLWIDGVQVLEKTGLYIRDLPTHTINRVMFGGWYSNSGSSVKTAFDPATPTSLLIDDVSVATTPRDVAPPPPATQTGTTLINEDFEDGRVDGFGYVPPISSQHQIVAGDSFGPGNQAYQITYATDEFDAKLEKYNVQGNTLDVSFASKLPDGIPIDETGRGDASLTLSRLARETGDPPGRGLQQWLTYYRAGSEGPNSPARYEVNYNVQFSDRVFRVPVANSPDAWLQTRYFIQFNTPGQNDGIFLVWHNGQLVVNARDVAFSDTVESRPDSALIGGHFSHGGTNPDRPFRRLIDAVHIAVNGDLPTT